MSVFTETQTELQPSREQSAGSPLPWPPKLDVFGVTLAPTTYAEATDVIVDAAARREQELVSCYAVHAVITFCSDQHLKEVSNDFDMITPDGQPVRWALNLLHGAKLKERVYGPELMLHICRKAAAEGVSIYLYGGNDEVAESLQRNLQETIPGLKIAGYEAPPFRPLTQDEDKAVIERINSSGAGIVFIGLGCPKQDLFAHEHKDSIRAVQVCVGAAFDFHAGVKSTAPEWMQKRGLEWLYRLIQEPKRLWRRYLVTNSSYCGRLFLSLLNVPKVKRQRAEQARRRTSKTT